MTQTTKYFFSLCLFLPGIFSEHYVAKIEAQRLRTEDDTQAELDRCFLKKEIPGIS